MSDCILPAFRQIQANPDGIDLLDLLVVGVDKVPVALAGNHPAAIIDSPFQQRITGIEFSLGFYIDI